MAWPLFAIYGQRVARFRFSGQASALSVDVSQTIVRGQTSRLNSLTDLPTSSPSDLPSYLPAGLQPSWPTDICDLPLVDHVLEPEGEGSGCHPLGRREDEVVAPASRPRAGRPARAERDTGHGVQGVRVKYGHARSLVLPTGPLECPGGMPPWCFLCPHRLVRECLAQGGLSSLEAN